jgi:transcription initiation factor TFIIIB Brf1 subunit/transcription initiation factor TFIIB
MIKKCPECGHKEFKYDERSRELYCNHCGLVLDDNSFVEKLQTFETSHEPLSDGLSVKGDMGRVERANNYKSRSKNKYDKLKSIYYYGILQDRLLDMGYCLSEALDIFNYCFIKFYVLDTNSNAPVIDENGKKHQKTQEQLVNDFFNSVRFEAFDVSVTVSRLKIPKELKSSWQP